MKAKKIITNSIVHIILAILGFIWVLPLFITVLTSFRKESGQYKTYIFPKEYTLDNYINLFSDSGSLNYSKWFMNTLIVSICCCIVSTLFVLCVAYTMSRLRFKMRKPMMNISLIIGMFPAFMSMIAVYYILKGIGLLETGQLKLVALGMVYSGGAGAAFFIAKGFFDTIPKALDEAAFLDGASNWDVFTKISLPLTKPIVVYTLMTSFMAPWIDFVFARVILGNDRTYYTVAVGLFTMLEQEFVEYYYTRFFAGAVIISIPISILFLFTQKYYAESMAGAVKG